MQMLITKPWLKVLSALLTNLAAGWFGVAFITPNFSTLSPVDLFLALLKDVIFGIICLITAAKIEEVLEL